MGMSSSQARLLSLTSRMHDIEYKAQNLEAQKLQMANESTAVYKEYENALNATKVQLKQLNNDGSIYYQDATYNLLIANGYRVEVNGDKRVPVEQAVADNFVEAAGNEDYFVALQTGRVTATNQSVDGVKEIYTVEQFMNIGTTGKYRLMSNIDLTGKNWNPKSFSGTLDGNGYSITGLTKNLFSSLGNGAKVSNLGLESNFTTSSQNAGLLANTVSGTVNIDNVNISGRITSTASSGYIGGLIGKANSNSNVTISNITSNVNISNSTGAIDGGGILGFAESATVTIKNSQYSGTISLTGGNNSIGGIIGIYQAGNTDINNCSSNLTAVSGTSSAGTRGVGGIVGTGWAISNANHHISNCESNLTSDADLNRVGGIAGYFQGEMENCYANSNISNNNSAAIAGGIVAINDGKIDNSYSDVIISGTTNKKGSIAASNTAKGQITNSSSSNSSINEVDMNNGSNDGNAADRTQITCDSSGASLSVNTTIDNAGASEARKLYQDMRAFGYFVGDQADSPVVGHEDDSNWFTTMLNMGLLFLFKQDSTTGEFYQVNVATDTNLQEVQDETDLKKAEAKYESDMRKINAKDKKFDTDLSALENERNAIKTEMETLKTVTKDNVDRTFKLFS